MAKGLPVPTEPLVALPEAVGGNRATPLRPVAVVPGPAAALRRHFHRRVPADAVLRRHLLRQVVASEALRDRRRRNVAATGVLRPGAEIQPRKRSM